jgi:DNA-binding NtrC family response regulator
MTNRVLIIDDDANMCALIEAALSPAEFAVQAFQSGVEALESISEQDVDVVVTDVRMPGLGGIELCRQALALRPDVPVIVLTAFGSMETAVDAIRAGAWDFLTKPVDLDALELVVRRAAQHRAMTRQLGRLHEPQAASASVEGMIGRSAAMRQVLGLLPRAARSDVPVLITGETGTGKELVARGLHGLGSRSSGPFLAVNCAALPEALLESELFGHERGAFTDARKARSGLFLAASGGTLFLDEVGELPLTLQPKILRALQERRIRPVGSNKEVGVDCRILAATNRDLRLEAEQGRFRMDLFYRLAVIELPLPPVRARAGDILLLAQHFLERAAERADRPVLGMTTPVARALLAYHWPGNVREIENAIERAVALTEHDHIVLDDLPAEIALFPGRIAGEDEDLPARFEPLESVERRHILRVLAAVDGNKSLAADILRIGRRTLYRKLERWAEDDNEGQQ